MKLPLSFLSGSFRVLHLLRQSASALAGSVHGAMESAHAMVVQANTAFAEFFAVPGVPADFESWESGRLIKDK